MNMKLRVLSVLLIFVMLFAACGRANTTDSEKAPDTTADNNTSNVDGESSNDVDNGEDSVLKDGNQTELIMIYPGNSSHPASLEEVENSMNSIIKDKVDATIKLKIFEWGVYTDQLNLILSSGENADIAFTFTSTINYANNGQIQPITQLVQDYAPEAYKLFEQYIDACMVNGELYGLPTFHEYTSKSGLVCRKDILDETGIDVSTIKTWDDIENVLKKVREIYPEMNLLTNAEQSRGTLQYYNQGIFDIIQADSGMGIYLDDDPNDGIEVVSIYSTPEYMELANKAYDWNKKGYFIPDATTISETRQDLIRAGNTFGYIGMIHPGTVTQETRNSGKEMVAIPVTGSGLTTGNVNFAQYMIPIASKNPEKALAFLNELYTNEDMQNLFMYGIEGEDYVVKDEEKGVAGYPEGKDGTSVGWSNEPWLSGNASISYAWETDPPTIWEDYLEFNASATVSPLFGFVFDIENVKNEISAVTNVITKYCAVIEAGYADPNESVTALNKELESAGIQKIIDEAQRQVDEWLANKN